MTRMIYFGLKRKLWNFKYLMKLFLMFCLIGGILHIDVLFDNLLVLQRDQIQLDKIATSYEEYLVDSVNDEYEWENNDTTERVLEIFDYENEKDLYEANSCYSNTKDPYLELVVYTIFFFIFMAKSIGSVQEIVEDKLSGRAKYLLTCISAYKYVICKILEGWIQVFIEYICMFVFICIWSIFRYGYPFINYLYDWMQNFIVLDGSYFRLSILTVGIISMLIGIFMIQYVIVLFMGKAKTIEEANHMIIWIHSFPICIYYVSMVIYDSNAIKYYKFIPFLQTLLLPMGLSFEGKISVIYIGNILLEGLFLYVLLQFSKNHMRKSILNIEKVTSLFKRT